MRIRYGLILAFVFYMCCAPNVYPMSAKAPPLLPRMSSPELCQALPPPTGPTTEVWPAQAEELGAIVRDARPGDTVLLHDGIYYLNGAYLWFATPGVTLRGYSGDPRAVILDGGYETTEVITVQASNVTITDLTILHAYTHGIHVFPPTKQDIRGTRIHRVAVIDAAEQAIKINANGGHYADEGEISCCHIALTDAGREHVRNDCYTGGIDAHQARGWKVRDCTIQGFWCASGLSEHGIHFWAGSRDTIVERNVLLDNVRGIGFGLVESGAGRTYGDDPCPTAEGYVDHYDGIVRNNAIYQGEVALYASEYGYDCGICLAQACGVQVVHNTVIARRPPFNSIEWRFPNTRASIINNLVSHDLMRRDGATATLAGNLGGASPSLFVDPAQGDLHLISATSAPVDAGVPLSAGVCNDDIDGIARPQGAGWDVGADEWTAGSISFPIPLGVGWNLVSIPLHPQDSAIEEVLATIAGSYEIVMARAHPWSEEWLWYDPHAPTSPLTMLDETMAFWVKLSQADTLVVSGSAPLTKTIPLHAGWNLIPYPSAQSL
ncbi:MAG: right-handed parallel beta-helix repeat-containing protein, partial [Chloroflexi bacterium]|nr:right-handed parallel beta-helix repeat-containing protein [Chloroflexota bacterium]